MQGQHLGKAFFIRIFLRAMAACVPAGRSAEALAVRAAQVWQPGHKRGARYFCSLITECSEDSKEQLNAPPPAPPPPTIKDWTR
jgi:hypothetical protein